MKSEKHPIFSIITVTFNSEKTLKRTFESLLNQSFKNFEYIVIDGNSQDNTLNIIKEYQSKFEEEGILFRWISENDNGIYYAMNKGIKKAKGEIVGIINSDDYYEMDALQKVYTYYTLNPTANVYHGILKYFNQNQLITIKGESDAVLNNRMIQHPATFITNKTYNSFGLYNTKYRYVADYELLIRIKEGGGTFLLMDEVIANFFDGGAGDNLSSVIESYNMKREKKIISNIQYFIKVFKEVIHRTLIKRKGNNK